MTPRRAVGPPVAYTTLQLAGETLFLRADRSLYWPATRTLLVADTHFGKDSVFRGHGLGIPAGTTDRDLARLGAAIDETGARRVIVLGDFVHAPPPADVPWLARLADWRARFAAIELVVVRGNHDRAARLSPALTIDWRPGGGFETPFVLAHEPSVDARGPTLAGHIHPVVRLAAGRERLRAPAFWRNARGLVLPAFSSFAGGARIDPAPRDRVFALGDNDIVEAAIAAPARRY